MKTLYDNQLATLDNIPLPRYDLLVKKNIGLMLPVQAGRGCPHLCSFCSIACVYKGRYLSRPLDDVLRDIKHIKSLGFKRFFLIDDNLVSDKTYLREFARRVKPLKMTWASQSTILAAKDNELLKTLADAGCSVLSIGLESLSQAGLDSLKKTWVQASESAVLLKKLRKAGIAVASEMIVGTNGDTPQTIKATADFIIKNKIPVPKFYILTPLPGTEFYCEMKSQNRLLHEDYTKYTAASCVFKPTNFTPLELEAAYMELYKTVYSYKNIFKRIILNRSIFKKPLLYLFFLIGNLVYKKSIKRGDAPNIL